VDDEHDLQQGVSLDLPPDEDDEDEEAQMAEIRRKILASKPFSKILLPNHLKKESQPPSNGEKPSSGNLTISAAEQPPQLVDSDAESGSDEKEYADFDQIANATPITDRTGIVSRARDRRS
jgi:pre-rRNA-processing protein TSR3